MPIRGKINVLNAKLLNVNFWFLLFAFISLGLAFNKIVLGIGFRVIPIVFILLGLITYLLNSRMSLYFFVFLLPIITAFPYFDPNGFPYNYMAVVLFYLSGIIIASIIKKEKIDFNYSWSIYYLFFLIIVWISSFFVFLKWSNITFSSLAFFKDTLVEPGGTRISFASIFPILTLLLFSVSPYIVVLLKKNRILEKKLFVFLLPGYCISVLISLYQMFVDPYFLKMKMKTWVNEADQFSGGFSDFNSLGFFSGIMFLSFVIFLINYLNKNGNKSNSFKKTSFYITGIIFSITGIFVSGSRTAFIFIISSMFLFFFSRQVNKRLKLIALIVFIVFAFVGGGVLKERISDTFDKFYRSFSSDNFIQSLDNASNGRIKMFQHSSMILKKYSIAGVGTGGFLFYLKNLKHQKKYYEDLPLNHYLLIFDENGFVGLIAFILFLVVVIKDSKDKSYVILLATIYIALFVNNFFWFPESLLMFWIIVAIGSKGTIVVKSLNKKKMYAGIGLILIFIMANVFTFKVLHPVNLTAAKNIHYDYGFWYPEKDSEGNSYNWSKSESGIFLLISKEGISKKIKISCGAPLSHLKDKSQNLKIFWKGKLYREINFTENRSIKFSIKDKPYSKGFLEFRVSPVFNLKVLGLSDETRDLGVQVFINERNE